MNPPSLSAAHWQPSVEPPHTCSPSSPTRAPSKRSSVQWARSAFPVNRRGAQHAPVVRPPFTFGHNLRPGFEFSPHARAGPRAAALDNKGASLSDQLVSAQHAVILLPDPRHAACGLHLSVHVQIVACQFSPTSCCTCKQSESSYCRPWSDLLTWHPSASTADIASTADSLLNQ
jgi:hypothetical protein